MKEYMKGNTSKLIFIHFPGRFMKCLRAGMIDCFSDCLHITAVLTVLLLCLFLTVSATCEAAAEDGSLQETGEETLKDGQLSDDGTDMFFSDEEEIAYFQETAPDAEETDPGMEDENSQRRRDSSKTVDPDGLIIDPEGNASIDNIDFEVTDPWYEEELAREEADLVSYGRLYPPAPLLDGINAFRQGDLRWGLHSYGYANAAGTVEATISSSGCGLLSLVNAVYYMTGRFIDPAALADWSCANGYRMNGVGTVHAMYQAYAKAYGERLGFAYAGTASSLSQIRDFLQEGGAAIVSTDHHLMAVVDYEPEKGGYLLLDSAPSQWRGTWPTGYCYHSLQEFEENIPIYAIMLLKRTGKARTFPGKGIFAGIGGIPCAQPSPDEFFTYIRTCYLQEQITPIYLDSVMQ